MKKNWLFLLYFILSTAWLTGQSENTLEQANQFFQNYQYKECADSYREFFNDRGMDCSDRNSAELLFQFGQALIYSKDYYGHEILFKAEDCIKINGSDSIYAHFLNVHAEIYNFSQQFTLAKNFYWKINRLTEISQAQRALNLAQLALASREENNDSTILYANRALDIALAHQDTTAIIQSYNALGLKYRTLNQLHQSIYWHGESLKYQKGNFAKKRSVTFNSLASLFTLIRDYSKAQKYVDSVYQSIDTSAYKNFVGSTIYTEARILEGQQELLAAKEKFKISIKKVVSIKSSLTARIGLIECLIELKDFKAVQIELEKAINLIETENDKIYTSRLYYLKALKALYNNDPQTAILLAHNGLAAKSNNLILNVDYGLNKLLATTYEKIGNMAESLKYYKIYYANQDSLNNSYDNALVYTLENEFIDSEQDKQLAQLETQQALQDVKFKQQRWLGLSLIGFLLLIGITIFSLINLRKKIRTQTQTIETAIEEKNILLQEIHHRVKNNLQVITSLFKLQSRHLTDEAAMNALNEGRNRVNSLAILHQNLYQEDNLKGVRMDNYIEQLCDALFSNSKIDHSEIHYSNHSESLILDIDTVIPIGLILTELVSSALKNKFSEKGEIAIYLKEENELLKLEVQNNGTALEQSDESEFINAFSQKIIQAFAKKLKAEFSTTNNGLFKATLSIKNYKKAI